MKIIPPNSTLGEIKIDLQVVFGSPSRACAGSGVCKMLPHCTGIPDTWSCHVWKGELHYLANDETKLNLSLNQQLADPALKKWFSAATFCVEEAFQLPLWLSSRLGKGRWFIPAGEYPYILQDSSR
jgi:hypothetical protein